MIKTIRDYNLNNKKIIIRVDFNVPMDNGIITDDNRIKESLETIKYAIENNAKIILLSHLGRIKEEKDKAKNSLKPVSACLSKLLKKEVIFISETRGKNLEDAISTMKSRDIILVENTRYEDIVDKKESSNNNELAKYWASLGDIFINDAFGTSHRSHASNVGIASILPSGIGFLVEKELNSLIPAIKNPKRPFTVILGGSKVSDKLEVIKNLVEIADNILIGGGMANTFLNSIGYDMGSSKIEIDNNKKGKEKINYREFCKEIIAKYKNKIYLPIDVITSTSFEDIAGEEKLVSSINNNELAMDIGNKTIDIYTKIISDSKQIIWNGPMGVFEFDNYSNGTKKICDAMSSNKGITIIGGGDSASAALKFSKKEMFTHISTGGGASLELLEGKKLPGIEIIDRKK